MNERRRHPMEIPHPIWVRRTRRDWSNDDNWIDGIVTLFLFLFHTFIPDTSIRTAKWVRWSHWHFVLFSSWDRREQPTDDQSPPLWYDESHHTHWGLIRPSRGEEWSNTTVIWMKYMIYMYSQCQRDILTLSLNRWTFFTWWSNTWEIVTILETIRDDSDENW